MVIFSDSLLIHNLYCFVGVVLFGIYLIIDTQMILGGKSIHLNVDEYIAAAMFLYIDEVQVVIYIIKLLRCHKNDN